MSKATGVPPLSDFDRGLLQTDATDAEQPFVGQSAPLQVPEMNDFDKGYVSGRQSKPLKG